MERRRRSTANRAKDPAIVWEALDLLKEEDWSPEQISANMSKHSKNISHELIYRHIRADETGELASHCRHKMKYNRHGRPDRTTKVRNIPGRVSIHQRPAEADGTRFGDREMDTIVGKDGKGTEPLTKVIIGLLFPYRNTILGIPYVQSQLTTALGSVDISWFPKL